MQIPRLEGLTFSQYTIAIRLTPDQSHSTEPQLHQQSARTCGSSSDNFSSSELELVSWNEVFFFKVDSPVCNSFLALIIVSFRGNICFLYVFSRVVISLVSDL